MVGVGLIAVNFVKCIIDIILNKVAVTFVWCGVGMKIYDKRSLRLVI